MNKAALITLAVSGVISLVCLVRLWCRGQKLSEKIYWSVPLLLPIIGPLFFIVFYRSPSQLPAGDRALPNSDAIGGFNAH